MYLSYDIKGIQKYIFAIPRLKSIVGGSLLIGNFDQRDIPQMLIEAKIENSRIFSGGGRGLIKCDQANAQEILEQLKKRIIAKAHELGLDVRIGINQKPPTLDDLRLYPFVLPADKTGPYLCQESGLYPVQREGETHEIVKKRQKAIERGNTFEKTILDNVRKYLSAEECLILQNAHFFRNVDADQADIDSHERAEIKASANTLGHRNRWAIVYMDGNDMGRQYKEQVKKTDEHSLVKWQDDFSRHLDECTRTAFYQALAKTISIWLKENKNLEECKYIDSSGLEILVLPFRPLILGGDDCAMLCHSKYALTFVKEMSQFFTEKSKQQSSGYSNQLKLWPATNNMLTISAGILYCKTKFPLATAMVYAESLLASAKGAFRATPDSNAPTPPAVDFDTITDALVDSPAQRRMRESIFTDSEMNDMTICLTRRPYLLLNAQEWKTDKTKNALTISQLEEDYIKPLEGLKNSIRSSLLPGLHQAWSLRAIFLASMAKNHKSITKKLEESSPDPNNVVAADSWWIDEESSTHKRKRKTAVIDALLILDEQRRMLQDTINQ